MRHYVTEIKFVDDKTLELWGVKYNYNVGGELEVRIFNDGEMFYKFEAIPITKTKHPTKSQALELIRIAKKMKNE